MANIYDMIDTWNDGATTFTAIKMNVTDTDSASGSLLMDLQVGGASKFLVNKGGVVTFTSNLTNTGSPNYVLAYDGVVTGAVVFNRASGSDSTRNLWISGQTLSLGRITTTNQYSPPRIRLNAEAEGVLSHMGGTTAQTFNLYKTYTDASNYERGSLKWETDIFQIKAEHEGTGLARGISIWSDTDIDLRNNLNTGYVHITKSGNTTGKLQISGGSAFGGGIIEGRNTKNGTLIGSLVFAGTGGGGNTFLDATYAGAKLQLRTQNTDRLVLDSVGSAQLATALTVATLPGTPAVGMVARVTDGDSGLTFGNTAVNSGAGATPYLVYYTGTNWTVIGSDTASVKSDTTQAGTGAATAANIVTISQTDYDALTPDADTIYFITG